MKEDQFSKYREAAEHGSIPENENPLFLFSNTSTQLLSKIALREFNVIALARMQLRERGVNDKGQWIGFQKAKKNNRQVPGV